MLKFAATEVRATGPREFIVNPCLFPLKLLAPSVARIVIPGLLVVVAVELSSTAPESVFPFAMSR